MSIAGSGGTRITPPACTPARFGLLSVAEVEDRSDAHWELGVEMDLATCEEMFVVTPCPGNPTGIKDPDDGTVRTVDADPFTMVAGYRCSTGGRDINEAWGHAEDRLNRGEARTLERAFWDGKDVADNVIRQSLGGVGAGAVDLTPAAGAVSITDGFAMLESYAGDNYPCTPILHAARGIGVYLAERHLTVREGQRLMSTGTGSDVVIGGGYRLSGPEGVAAPAGEAWMYVTGRIKVVRGAVFFTPERGNAQASVDRARNDQTVFAERPYSILMDDCILGAVRVNLKSCCC